MNVLTTQAPFLVRWAAQPRAGVKTMWNRFIFLTTAGEEAHIAWRYASDLNSCLAKPVDDHQSKAISGPGMSWLNLNQPPGAV